MGDRKQKTVLIVIPAYNEAATIKEVIASLPRSFQHGSTQFTVKAVVIDDCSNDSTHEEAEKAGVVVLRHVVNSGAGAATRTGLRYAEQLPVDEVAYAVTIDGDGQHSANDIEKMLHAAIEGEADMVIGNRLHAGNNKDMPLHRTVGNMALSFISRVLFKVKTRDTQSGLRLFRTEIIPKISTYTIDRYGFCTEMLWLAVRGNLNVQEVPISVKYSKETMQKGQNVWGAAELLKDLLWIRLSG